MKKFFWLCGGYPSMEACTAIVDAYMAGGCDGVEWAIPPANPYREQAHLLPYFEIARRNCPDPAAHLAQMAAYRKKYPSADVFPAVYQETVVELGVDRLCELCLSCGIHTLFLIGTFAPEIATALSKRMQTATAVSYYMTEQELAKARQSSGFIYMQALPYQSELDAGYTKDRLRECICAMRGMGLTQPIYCAKGIRTPQDAAFVAASGADGFILGSAMLQYYGDLPALQEAVQSFQAGKAGEKA